MEHLYLGIELRNTEQTINDRIAEIRALHEGLQGVVVWDDEFAEKRLTRGDDHGDMIQTGAFPHRVGLLPLPCVVIHTTEFWCKGTKKSAHTQEKNADLREMPPTRRRNSKKGDCASVRMSATSRRNAKKIYREVGGGLSATSRRNTKKRNRSGRGDVVN